MTTASLPVDFAKLEDLISHKDFVGAKKIIDDVVDQNLSPQQKGEVYVKVASIYLTISNKLSAAYLEQLDSTLDLIKQATKSEKKTDDDFKMVEVQQNLAANS
ncbi:MAG: hypothetical protein RL094_140 [Candidatus Parcubacteria bacterium]|jgi:hypothetical protein